LIAPLHPLTRFRRGHQPQLSQAELGRMLGVSRSYINRIESGTRQISIEMLARASLRTGLPPALLRPDLRAVLK
jgi:transcriptional regulator with XRE-family HTH domain